MRTLPAWLSSLACFAVVLFGAPVASAEVDAGVRTAHGDVARTGEMPGPGPNGEDALVQRWVFAPEEGVVASPAVVDGVAYVSGWQTVWALDAATGAELWSFALTATEAVDDGAWFASASTVADVLVYVPAGDGRVFALDAASGAKVWTYRADWAVYAAVAVSDGTVFVKDMAYGDTPDQHALYALEAATGRERWRSPVPLCLPNSHPYFASNFGPPTVAGGVVYVGVSVYDTEGGDAAYAGSVYAFDAASGALRWRAATAGGVQMSPAVRDGMVYASSITSESETLSYEGVQTGIVQAFDADDGFEVWQFELAGGSRYAPAVAGGVVYAGAHTAAPGTGEPIATLHALDARSGRELWRYQSPGLFASSPAVADGIVYTVVYTGYSPGKSFVVQGATLLALDPTGSVVWNWSFEASDDLRYVEFLYLTPTVIDGAVYAVRYPEESAGELFVIANRDGST